MKEGLLRAGDSGPGRLKPEKSIGGESWSCRQYTDSLIRSEIQSTLRVRCFMEKTNLKSRVEDRDHFPE